MRSLFRALLLLLPLLYGVLRCAAPARADSYALIIASGEFVPGSPYTDRAIDGPKTDARLMTSLLLWRFGFPAQNIQIVGLSRQEAARIAPNLRLPAAHADFAAVQRGFQWLAQVASHPADTVVIYYAGHGKRVSNPDRLARDVNSEALVTYDADAYDSNLVRDVQIKAWLNRIASRRKTVIVDCCFSGDMIREVQFDPQGLAGRRVVRGIGADREVGSGHAGSNRRVFGDDLPVGTVLLAACGRRERAYEKQLLPLDGMPATAVGEFTWALYHVLCREQGALSYEGLRGQIEDRLRLRGLTQIPALLGTNEAAEAIGPAPWRDAAIHLPLAEAPGRPPLLSVGWFGGLRANRALLLTVPDGPIHLSDLGWFDARPEGLAPGAHNYITVRQFP